MARIAGPPPLLVFTDLDGTLLDHETYGWAPARPALARLAAIRAVVIPATSKTRAEVAPLMAEMGLTGPAIVENGAGAIRMPAGATSPPPCIDRIRAAIASLPAEIRLPFQSFGNMTSREVAARTGLPMAAAARARAREFSEPGAWTGGHAALAAFEAALAPHGLTLRQGGRFMHVLHGVDKAQRMAEIIAALGPCPVIALGDAPNDAEMLQAADIAIMVPNPSGPPPFTAATMPAHAILAPGPGPAGWAAAIGIALDALGLSAAPPRLA
jgi:mannosyl-3-phosphoglycerate phosphatase